MDRTQRAKEIIERTPIATLATVSADGKPRSTPVGVAWDSSYNCYWTSFGDTEHSKNIRTNGLVCISMFDSSVPHLESSGVYVDAKAVELVSPGEIEEAAKHVYDRKGKSVRPIEDFMGNSPKRLYKAVPERAWVNLNEDAQEDPQNARKEIIL